MKYLNNCLFKQIRIQAVKMGSQHHDLRL